MKAIEKIEKRERQKKINRSIAIGITDKHGVPSPMLRQDADRACYLAQWGRGCFMLYH